MEEAHDLVLRMVGPVIFFSFVGVDVARLDLSRPAVDKLLLTAGSPSPQTVPYNPEGHALRESHLWNDYLACACQCEAVFVHDGYDLGGYSICLAGCATFWRILYHFTGPKEDKI